MNWKKAALAAGAGAIEVVVIIFGYFGIIFATFDPNPSLFGPQTPPDFRDFLFVAGYVVAVVLGGTLPGIVLKGGFLKSLGASTVAHLGLLPLLSISTGVAFLVLLIPPMVVTLVAISGGESSVETRRQQNIIVVGLTVLMGIFVLVTPENFSLIKEAGGLIGWIVIPAAGALLSPRSGRGRQGP